MVATLHSVTDYEPYVAEPAERPARRRLAGRRGTVGFLAALVLAAALAWVVGTTIGEQDPALEPPAAEEPGT